MAEVRFLLTGDTSLTAEFGNEISESVNARIRAFNIALESSKLPGIVETVPTYRSLMIHYDPGVIQYGPLVKKLQGLLGDLDRIEVPLSQVLEIPVLYGGEMGPDLDGSPIAGYRAVAVKAGQVLRFTGPRSGCRAFLAFAGGLDIPVVMGSRSTDLKAKIGGLHGRKLEKGDVSGLRAPRTNLKNLANAPRRLQSPGIGTFQGIVFLRRGRTEKL